MLRRRKEGPSIQGHGFHRPPPAMCSLLFREGQWFSLFMKKAPLLLQTLCAAGPAKGHWWLVKAKRSGMESVGGYS